MSTQSMVISTDYPTKPEKNFLQKYQAKEVNAIWQIFRGQNHPKLYTARELFPLWTEIFKLVHCKKLKLPTCCPHKEHNTGIHNYSLEETSESRRLLHLGKQSSTIQNDKAQLGHITVRYLHYHPFWCLNLCNSCLKHPILSIKR